MKKSVIKTSGILLLSILFVSGINAQQYRHGQGSYGPGTNQGKQRLSFADRLDLTEEQQETLKALQQEQYKNMQPLRNKMNELRARERTLLSGEKIDKDAVGKVIDEQTELTNQMRKLQLDHRLAVREILTEEQLLQMEMQRDRRHDFNSSGNERWGSPRKGRSLHRIWG
jgi:Spy/CpxP family protein refolding chaperone